MSEASESGAINPRRRRASWTFIGIVAAALALLFGAAVPASAAELMRVTFVRHGESAGNASGLIDTSTPGPVLTAKGQQQAEAVVGRLGGNNYDGIYASTMVRTQLTAAPMSEYLHLPTQVLPGLQEIEAGVFEGTPESQAANGYARFPLGWVFQGNRELRIPGSINGNEFDARVDGALQTIYDNGDRNAIVYSHGGAIMFWTLMNAQNLTMEQKLDLLRNYSLNNTDAVVIEGNPEDGWNVVNWNGQELSAEPTLGAEVQLQLRTLSRQLATAAKQVADAFATMNPATILAAATQGVADVSYSITKFAGAVTTKLVTELGKLAAAPSTTPSVQSVSTLKAASAPAASAPAVAPDTVAARTVAAETAPTTEPAAKAASKARTGDAAPAIASTTAEVASPAAELKAVEAPASSATPSVSPNGATDLKDGNKSVPGTSSAAKDGDAVGKKPTATVEPATAATGAADTGEAGADAGEGTSKQSDAA